MRKYSKYFLLMIVALTGLFPSCSDDDDAASDDEYSSSRLFMPMFRREENTGVDSDPYDCAIASEATYSTSNYVNDIQLYWYGVTGASGYRLKAKIQGTDWDEDEVLDTLLGADVIEYLHEDLQYSVTYSYAIQAISPDGEEYNSKWYGYGDGSHQKDYMNITTGDRYDVPAILWTEDVTYTTVEVHFNPSADDDDSDWATTYSSFISAGGEVDDDGNWVFDEIQIIPTSDNPDLATLYHTMTDADFEAGYVLFEGLESNGAYIVQCLNNNVARYYDRQYNKIMIRMLGDPGDPITIPYYYDPEDTILSMYYSELQACRIDTVLSNYNGDSSLAEGQVYYLEGGKNYYFGTSVSFTKGLTLETDPDDIAAGTGRANVYIGVGRSSSSSTASANTVTLMLSRNAEDGSENGALLSIQDIVFNELNIRPEFYENYVDKNGTDGNSSYSISANYFLNMYSQGLGFTLTNLKVTNCTFSGLTRGFIRFQGPNRQLIENLIVDNCVFHDCGPYDTNGRGYSWLAGPGTNKNSNFYQNLEFTNNTLIDCPKHALVTENSNLAWPSGTTWNITIANNTFINFSPRSSSSSHGLMFETRYAPSGSTFACYKNLFVMVRKGDSDGRNLYMRGMRLTSSLGYTFNFYDNYATTVPDWTTSNLTDGLFTNYAFSISSSGAGYMSGAFNYPDNGGDGYGETQIKFGDNVNGNEEDDSVGYELTPEELFKDPQPLATDGYVKMHLHNIDGLYYNTSSSKVMAHPIVTKRIGDCRWLDGDDWGDGDIWDDIYE